MCQPWTSCPQSHPETTMNPRPLEFCKGKGSVGNLYPQLLPGSQDRSEQGCSSGTAGPQAHLLPLPPPQPLFAPSFLPELLPPTSLPFGVKGATAFLCASISAPSASCRKFWNPQGQLALRAGCGGPQISFSPAAWPHGLLGRRNCCLGCAAPGGKLSLACALIASCIPALGSEDARQDKHPCSLCGFALPQLYRQRTALSSELGKGHGRGMAGSHRQCSWGRRSAGPVECSPSRG